LLKVRGLWWSTARNCSARLVSKATRIVWGRREPGRRASKPTALNWTSAFWDGSRWGSSYWDGSRWGGSAWDSGSYD
jgi:hypothetical protein